MLTYDEAIARILDGIGGVDATDVALLDALGMTLASDVVSPIDLPVFANSQMDGYAVIAADTAGASEAKPASLSVVGEVAAGGWPGGAVTPGVAVRIFTGAPVPEGADAIVPIEDVAPAASPDEIGVTVPADAGQYIRVAGEDVRAGETVLRAGFAVTPAVLAMAAATGHDRLTVYRRPRVCVIGTGDELTVPGTALGAGGIYDSNSYTLAALVTQAGAECVQRQIAADTPDALAGAFAHAMSVAPDVIVSCGGVSVGERDLVRPVFADFGEVDFWRVAIRPGKPFVFGRFGSGLFFGLPGNPASAMVTFELFVRPALMALQSRADLHRPKLSATLTEPVSHHPGRRSFIRALTRVSNSGDLQVAPAGGQGSHLFRSMVASNSLLILHEDIEELPAGAKATVLLTGDLRG